jgi:hypothetical protein
MKIAAYLCVIFIHFHSEFPSSISKLFNTIRFNLLFSDYKIFGTIFRIFTFISKLILTMIKIVVYTLSAKNKMKNINFLKKKNFFIHSWPRHWFYSLLFCSFSLAAWIINRQNNCYNLIQNWSTCSLCHYNALRLFILYTTKYGTIKNSSFSGVLLPLTCEIRPTLDIGGLMRDFNRIMTNFYFCPRSRHVSIPILRTKCTYLLRSGETKLIGL